MRTASIFALFSVAACASPVGSPPQDAGIDPFYVKYVSASGIPVLSSSRVPDDALFASRDMISAMLAQRPDLAAWLAASDYRVAIMGRGEGITDLPENRGWTKPAPDDQRLTRCERKHYDARVGLLSDREYWDARVRGIGGKRTVAAEEDVLGLRDNRYWGETILVHEFAHGVHDAIRAVDPALSGEIDAAYEAALADRLWFEEYATTTVEEYWAEGTQFWFNSNRLAVMDGRRVLNHQDLAAYDPRLYAVLAKAYGDDHRLDSDPFYLSDARVPPGPIPENTAEVC